MTESFQSRRRQDMSTQINLTSSMNQAIHLIHEVGYVHPWPDRQDYRRRSQVLLQLRHDNKKPGFEHPGFIKFPLNTVWCSVLRLSPNTTIEP